MIILVWRKHWFFSRYSLTLIRLRIHWPTLTIIRYRWSCNRLQYLKLCASSLSFSSLSWRLVAPEEMDWLSLAMVLSRIQCASCSCMYCKTFLRLKKLWLGISGKDYGRAVVRALWRFLKVIISFYSTDTIQLWSRCHAYATAFFASLRRVNASYRWKRDFLCHADSVFNFNWMQLLLDSLEYCIFIKLDMNSSSQFRPLDIH